MSGSIYTHRKLFAHLAKAVGARALLPSYRFLPAARHPAALDDTVVTHRWLLDAGLEPRYIALAGDSAGGNLSLTTLLRARDEGTPLPAAVLLLSPWTDVALTGETIVTNADSDVLFSMEWLKQRRHPQVRQLGPTQAPPHRRNVDGGRYGRP